MFDKLRIQRDFPLADLTTFKIGGSARCFIKAETEGEVLSALEFADRQGLEVFVLGGGSNILISDAGYDGLVIQIGIQGISVSEQDEGICRVVASAGEDWDEFVEFCVDRNLAGIECLSGIPGLVGGTPIQNVGAYGQEVSETIISVRVLDRRTLDLYMIEKVNCGFEYRKSIFNSTEKDRYIVLSVTYALKHDGDPKIVYADLKEKFQGRNPTLEETRETVREIRREKGMLVRQGGLDSQSAGSFFKNPIVSTEKFDRIKEFAKANNLGNVPSYSHGSDNVKVPAAWLIEQAGFHKGYEHGRVGLSTKHTLALTNRGSATAREIVDLKEVIKVAIEQKFGIELIPEPNLIGF